MPTQPPDRPPHAAWLVLPEVTRAIEGELRRRGLRGADLEDHRQIVLERALLAPPPPALGECIVMVQTIARNLAFDTFRQKRSRAKVDAGPYETPDERPANDRGDAVDRIEERQQLDFVRAEIATGGISPRQAAILTTAADDVPQPEIAGQLNLAHSTVRNELSAARRAVRLKWAAFAAAAIAIFGVIFQQTRPELVGSPPPAETARPRRDPRELAERLRKRALQACAEQEWAVCAGMLDDARLLDPAGDELPAVVDARRAAREHLHPAPRPGGDQPSQSGSGLPEP